MPKIIPTDFIDETFYKRSFGRLLIYDVPAHEVYIRSLILVSFLMFGVIISKVLAKHMQTEKEPI